jgi:hypothetical protein
MAMKKLKKGDLITDRHGSYGIVLGVFPRITKRIPHKATRYKVQWLPEGEVRNPFGVDIELVARA